MDFGCTGGWSVQQGDDRLGLQERRPPKFDRVSGRHRSVGLGGQGEADVWGRNADCGSNNFPDSPSQIVALNFLHNMMFYILSAILVIIMLVYQKP